MARALNKFLYTINELTNKLWEIAAINNVRNQRFAKVGLFVITFFCYYSYIGVFKYIHIRPSSLHISAQCQRASIALNYYKTDMNFFKPRIQRQLEGDGITGVEFPIIYYTGAVMYKLFGFDEVYLRSISLVIVTYGFFFFYLLANYFIRNYIISLMLVIAASLSPVLLFYTPNFMPDAPSFALHLSAWYFFFKYLKTHKNSHLGLFLFVATLGALIKATAAIVFVVIICLLILDRLKFFKTSEKTYYFSHHLKILKGIVLGILIVFSWYYYASWLGKHYHNESFALRPLMVDDWNVVKEIFDTIKNLWVRHFYAYESYVLIISCFVGLIVLFKFANRMLLSITLLNFVGYLCYIYLFLYQFKWHDYYIITILPFVFFLVLTVGEMIVRFSNNYFKPVQVIFMLVLFFNMKESMIYCKTNYVERNTRAIYYWTGDYRAYEDLEPKLRKLGINRTDKFLSVFDDTYCSSLYLMDQLGVCFSNEATPDDMKEYLNNPLIKYVIVNDSVKFNKFTGQDLSNNIVTSHRGLIIYKLKH